MATEKRLIFLDEAIARIKDDGILGTGYSDDERIDDVLDMLECCHIVDAVEVVHGEWSTIEDDYTGLVALQCSVCNQEYWFEDEPPIKIYNYCPNCGAKMDGERKDND